ncbi:MAG: hypothetical protein ACE14S_09450 [Candidatus Bathyarchaeia archaeon]
MKKNTELKTQLPLVTCECGAKILLIPQVEVMSRAIESHAGEHRKKEPDPAKAEATARHIRELLIEKTLETAARVQKEKLDP